MENKISVILPVYQKDKVEYIHLSVNSILEQSFGKIKLFIGVDGPVGDDIRQCLIEYGRDERVKVVWFEENRGLACVLNDLLELSFKEGFEFIARMDADDISLPDRFKKQMEFLQRHFEIDVVGGWSLVIDENGTFQGRTCKHPETPDECRKVFAYINPLGHPAVLFRKRFFDKAGCLYRSDHRVNQDTLLWFDGLKKDVKMGNVQEPVIYFRSTNDMYKNRRGGFKKAKKQFFDRLMINRGLKYSFWADIYAFGVFILMISPTFIRKKAYQLMNR